MRKIMCPSTAMEMLFPESTMDRLYEILSKDDPARLKEFLEDEDMGVWRPQYDEVTRKCLICGAKKCALFMLTSDFSEGIGGQCSIELFKLASAIRICDPEIVEILFERFDAKEIANLNTALGYLPIHTFLTDLDGIFPVNTWVADDSLVKLLIILCDPQLRKQLHCLRLLANHTDSLPEVASAFLLNGDVVQLAALLLVAHSSLLHHLKACYFEKYISSMKDMNGIISLVEVGKFPNPCGFGLIDIFEKAGDSLTNFYTKMPEDISGQDVIKSVAEILIREAHIPVAEEDVDLVGVLSVEPEVMPSIHQHLSSIQSTDGRCKGEKPMFPSLRSPDLLMAARGEVSKTLRAGFQRRYDNMYKLKMGRCLYSTATFQSPRKCANSQGCVSPSLSPTLRSVTSLATRLGRGIRFL